MKISLDEINHWKEFEDLIADYFTFIRNYPSNNLVGVTVEPSGEGSDGGRDILLTFDMDDSIHKYSRKWVVQCKFYQKAVSKSTISNVNIPSLIHEYGADGYLLVCKSGVTSKVSEMFENLRRNCKFHYSYEIWDERIIKNRILVVRHLLEKYFPEYNSFLEEKDKLLKK